MKSNYDILVFVEKKIFENYYKFRKIRLLNWSQIATASLSSNIQCKIAKI